MYNAGTLAHAGLAGIALVILSASVAEATYGPRTKIGNNYQQTSTTRSLNASTEGNCNGSGSCYVLFQVPPAQKPLIVQHVACNVQVTAGDLRFGRLQTRKGSTFPLRSTHFVPVNTTGNVWVVNSPVMHLVESGERPLIVLSNSAAADWTAECTISGKLQ
jgi:hypothetical protein